MISAASPHLPSYYSRFFYPKYCGISPQLHLPTSRPLLCTATHFRPLSFRSVSPASRLDFPLPHFSDPALRLIVGFHLDWRLCSASSRIAFGITQGAVLLAVAILFLLIGTLSNSGLACDSRARILASLSIWPPLLSAPPTDSQSAEPELAAQPHQRSSRHSWPSVLIWELVLSGFSRDILCEESHLRLSNGTYRYAFVEGLSERRRHPEHGDMARRAPSRDLNCFDKCSSRGLIGGKKLMDDGVSGSDQQRRLPTTTLRKAGGCHEIGLLESVVLCLYCMDPLGPSV